MLKGGERSMANVVIAASDRHLASELKELMDNYHQSDLLVVCQSDAEVLNLIKEQSIDLLFVDINLPREMGLSLVHKVKEITRDLWIVLMAEDEGLAATAYEIGVSDFLLKPMRRERVLKILERGLH